MVLPWSGIALADRSAVPPTSRAKFVAFETLYDPGTVAGTGLSSPRGGIDSLCGGLAPRRGHAPLPSAMGLYGKPCCPPRTGLPSRLVVPWKYGFKASRASSPSAWWRDAPTTWNLLARTNMASANVSPQAWITRAGARRASVSSARGIFGAKRQPTLMFNGYGDEVASLYQGMDLRRWY